MSKKKNKEEVIAEERVLNQEQYDKFFIPEEKKFTGITEFSSGLKVTSKQAIIMSSVYKEAYSNMLRRWAVDDSISPQRKRYLQDLYDKWKEAEYLSVTK